MPAGKTYGKYLRGKGGKRYARSTNETRRKIAAYKKKNKKVARNAMRPLWKQSFVKWIVLTVTILYIIIPQE